LSSFFLNETKVYKTITYVYLDDIYKLCLKA